MLQPLVSIIIPTYNRANLIGESIKSVLDQTYVNFELLIADDGSIDNTEEVVKSFKDDRVHYFFQKNTGRSTARNLVLQKAKGKYIAFLDSDDLYLPEKTKMQVEFLENNLEYSMVYTSALCIDEQGASFDNSYKAVDSGWIYDKIAYFVNVTVILPTVMVRREVFVEVGNFDENMDRFEDTDMWRRISKKFRVYAMTDQTCLIRTHTDNSLLNQNPEKIIESLEYYKKKIIKEDKHVSLRVHKKNIKALYIYYIKSFMSVPEFYHYGKKLYVLFYTGDSNVNNHPSKKLKANRAFLSHSKWYSYKTLGHTKWHIHNIIGHTKWHIHNIIGHTKFFLRKIMWFIIEFVWTLMPVKLRSKLKKFLNRE